CAFSLECTSRITKRGLVARIGALGGTETTFGCQRRDRVGQNQRSVQEEGRSSRSRDEFV
ncbi:hypothetical protein FRC20_006054, partial [Serendipita sp. 405]